MNKPLASQGARCKRRAPNFQSLPLFAFGLQREPTAPQSHPPAVLFVMRRYGLSPKRAVLIAELAGLGGAR